MERFPYREDKLNFTHEQNKNYETRFIVQVRDFFIHTKNNTYCLDINFSLIPLSFRQATENQILRI